MISKEYITSVFPVDTAESFQSLVMRGRSEQRQRIALERVTVVLHPSKVPTTPQAMSEVSLVVLALLLAATL